MYIYEGKRGITNIEKKLKDPSLLFSPADSARNALLRYCATAVKWLKNV